MIATNTPNAAPVRAQRLQHRDGRSAGWYLTAGGQAEGDALVLWNAARRECIDSVGSGVLVFELSAEALMNPSDDLRLALEAVAGLYRSTGVAVRPAAASADLAAARRGAAWMRRVGIATFAIDDGDSAAGPLARATRMSGTLAIASERGCPRRTALMVSGSVSGSAVAGAAARDGECHATRTAWAPESMRSGATKGILAAGLLFAGLLSGCGSPPKPVEPDGSFRVPVNEPSRLAEYQRAAESAERAFDDRTRLAGEVRRLQGQVEQLSTAVRVLLLQPPQPQGGSVAERPAPPAAGPAARLFERVEGGAVLRVFQPFGAWHFDPTDGVRAALQEAVRAGASFEVRGYTDSEVADAGNRRVATGRVVEARRWLMEQGAKSESIKVKPFTSGHFLADNTTSVGRAVNRRVEIEVRAADVGAIEGALKKLEG